MPPPTWGARRAPAAVPTWVTWEGSCDCCGFTEDCKAPYIAGMRAPYERIEVGLRALHGRHRRRAWLHLFAHFAGGGARPRAAPSSAASDESPPRHCWRPRARTGLIFVVFLLLLRRRLAGPVTGRRREGIDWKGKI
ncbi:Os09g0566700 [Oryza sativa Japonica Group]|uniref:Os09g0566700 protein n=2 Tax=Oryza TaxID=4527 RepID=Q650U9_ORYSJ|nr:hypothetical protein DAI22_09g203700 [Oryza sativa Japonica Group]BAD46246.1 unknown protein [Oryza sativa Japonica Group]BAD46668.1 unknown protein [Oryza sativa Japonica Group]BAH94717.1 Os09g0566700 [Oryza sativa Japonica Group]|eukprot:NP_001175989.1 Os09g0566700 [Oryza sativa Japonica Group]